MKLGFESFFYISRISKAELFFENQQTWREENSDLKEKLETMKKRYGTNRRNVS
jgi:threonyl-tRNA synthetase